MKKITELQNMLEIGTLDSRLCEVYGCEGGELASKRVRLDKLMKQYKSAFGTTDKVGLYSGPGRTELGGNHTDHQHGCVLAAAVELDAIACACSSQDGIIHILSEGYPDVSVDLSQLSPQKDEIGTSAALVRGIAAKITEMGYSVGGFRACISSNVLGGSGLSSSAAYEVLIGVIINDIYCGGALSPIEIAQIGQYAENVFFGKPCGLMDQLTSAVGGVVAIDFCNPAQPVVKRLNTSLPPEDYSLCVIDSGADHQNLTEEYAAIPGEMCAVAAHFDKSVLREVNEADLWAEIPKLRAQLGDRAILRSIHFFNENRLAQEEARVLESGDFLSFLSLVHISGKSSAMHLQNLYCSAKPHEQALSIAIAAAESILGKNGAVRVHGGGFAGTVQAYVPNKLSEEFRLGMESILGVGCCHFLRIRPVGGAVLA